MKGERAYTHKPAWPVTFVTPYKMILYIFIHFILLSAIIKQKAFLGQG